jgi:hypothetical protein
MISIRLIELAQSQHFALGCNAVRGIVFVPISLSQEKNARNTPPRPLLAHHNLQLMTMQNLFIYNENKL